MPSRRPSLAITLPQLWLFLAVALPVVASLLAPIAAVDLAYGIRAGNELLDSGRITTVDTYTFTVAGAPWLNQQWAAQAVFALVHRIGGWELLHVLRAALVGVVFGGVLVAVRRRGASPRVAAGLTLAAFIVALGGLALRPQLLGLVLFAVSLAIVAGRDRRPRALWSLVPIAIVWANVHGSFFLVPVLVGWAWLEDVAARRPETRATFLVGIAATAATLLNPYLLGVWAYALGLSTNPSVTAQVTEWQPASLASVPGALFFASVLGVVALLARRGRPAPWPTLLWLAFLFLLGIYAVRGISWWALGAAVSVAGLVGGRDVLVAESRRTERASPLGIVIAAVVVVAGIALLPWWRPASGSAGQTGVVVYAPSGITDYLGATVTADDRIFVSQPWASWLEWAVPRAPVAIDSRFELFPPDVWADAVTITSGREGWRDLLDRLGVTIIVVDDERNRDLGDRLESSDGWARTYADDAGRVFVRAHR